MKKKLRKKISAAVSHLEPKKYPAYIYDQYDKGSDKNGDAIPRMKTREYFPVNHINRAKRLYLKGGWPAVERYVQMNAPKKKLLEVA